jgi:glyoxylase-like metal-dependent hydrolase (beta-lactamase superfamily II)/ferredoxin
VAKLLARLPENAPGEYFVDETCIDCATCRIVAPSVFAASRSSGMSFVRSQPVDEAGARRASMALVACPTSSIGTVHKQDNVRQAARAFPEPIEDGVHYCGYASERSYGASSYFIARAEGNIQVDSPRAARPLMDRIEALGGIALMFLTHRDDVADHAKFARRFGCKRVIHADDLGHGMRDVERRIERQEPTLLAPDLQVIPVPGHTRGSMALLYKKRFLFTGDHLWGREDGSALSASRSVCWHSWGEQTRSMERLLDFDFEWVLPGHGVPFRAPRAQMRQKLEELIARMKRG